MHDIYSRSNNQSIFPIDNIFFFLYRDMFPVIIEKLKIIEENISNESMTDYQINNFIELIGALEAVVHVAGSNKSQQAKFNRRYLSTLLKLLFGE